MHGRSGVSKYGLDEQPGERGDEAAVHDGLQQPRGDRFSDSGEHEGSGGGHRRPPFFDRRWRSESATSELSASLPSEASLASIFASMRRMSAGDKSPSSTSRNTSSPAWPSNTV